MSFASSVLTGRISSTSAGSQSGGVRPIPTPSILCAPGGPPRSTEDSAGSTTTIRTPGLWRFSTVATPREEAAVPAEWTKASISPVRLAPDLLARASGSPRCCPGC